MLLMYLHVITIYTLTQVLHRVHQRHKSLVPLFSQFSYSEKETHTQNPRSFWLSFIFLNTLQYAQDDRYKGVIPSKSFIVKVHFTAAHYTKQTSSYFCDLLPIFFIFFSEYGLLVKCTKFSQSRSKKFWIDRLNNSMCI